MAQSKVGVIAQDLVDKIKHQQYQPGDYLPSEHQLMDLYGASRETIRKALNSLTDLGLIQKIRGKGSGSIEEDADVGVTLMELNIAGEKNIIATLFKNRYGDKKNISYRYKLDNRLCLILESKNYV